MLSEVAVAVQVTGLYQVSVPVEDQTSGERLKGMSSAIKEVLIRVSGSRGVVENPELSSAIVAPSRYVKGYRYEKRQLPEGDGNQLVVEFSAKAVQSLLVQKQLPVWSEQRPEVLLWLAVEERKRRYILKDSSVHLPNQAINDAAAARGLPLAWPLDSDIEIGKVKVADIKAGFDEQISKASKDYNPHGILVGYIKELRNGSWLGRWQLVRGGQVTRWKSEEGSLSTVMQSGIDPVADVLAEEFAIAGVGETGAEPLRVKVENVNTLDHYADSRAYLDSLLITDKVNVIQVHKDYVEYQLSLRGQHNEFVRAIQLGRTMRILPQVIESDTVVPDPELSSTKPDLILELIP